MAAPVSKAGRPKNYTLRIPQGLTDRLTEVAKSRGLHRQELITAILREWVAAHDKELARGVLEKNLGSDPSDSRPS